MILAVTRGPLEVGTFPWWECRCHEKRDSGEPRSLGHSGGDDRALGAHTGLAASLEWVMLRDMSCARYRPRDKASTSHEGDPDSKA